MTNYALHNHRWYLVFFLIILLSSSIVVTAAARLPAVGGDSGNWGTVLNQYLNVSLNGTGQLRPDTISSNNIVDSTIQDADISDTTNLTLGQKITFALGEIIDNIVNDWIRITGNLNVTKNITAAYFVGDGSQLTAITLPDGGVTAAKIATGAVNTTHILDGTITAPDLATNSVNTTHIVDGTITSTDISGSANILDGQVTDALTISGGTIGSNTISAGSTWTTAGQLTIGDGGDSINISTTNWKVSPTGVITGASIASTQLTDGGTISFNWVDGEVADALTITGSVLNNNQIGAGATWTTNGQFTLGDGGDAILINTSAWDISLSGVITGASIASTQLTDGGTLGFDWVDAEIADTLTIDALSSVDSTALTDGGTISFDWTDDEVENALTVTGGTIGSNTISAGSTWTTTGTLTIGDGGDFINISTTNWKVSPTGVITGASMASTQLTDGGTISFDWTDDEVADALTINGGTVTWTDLTSYPSACSAGSFLTAIGDTITCTGGIRNGTVSGANQMITDSNAMGGSFVLGLMNSAANNSGATHDILRLSMSGQSTPDVTGVDTYISFSTMAGEIGDISGTATPGQLLFTSFTGGHWSQTNETNLKEGELLISTGQLLDNAAQLTKVVRTSKPQDSRVYGVYGGSKGNDTSILYGDGGEIVLVLALGTGVIRVTDTNGDINNGDFITSSSRAGYGQKQSDDLFHTYTIAKSTEDISWANISVDPATGFKWKLISATYHAG